MTINPGDRVIHWVNGREIQCVDTSETSVYYRYVEGDPPGEGHSMLLDRWRWLANRGAKPVGKRHIPGAKVRQR
jgi:hypothetical protein